MTERHNIWLMRDESAQQAHGAVRADTITEITTQEYNELRLLRVSTTSGNASLGYCDPEHHDHFVNGLLTTLRQAEESKAHFVVIAAIPPNEQDGTDQNFWSVFENEWPIPRQPVPAARTNTW
ncbi:hypothetical protein [Paractinoplanes atraurantiacus]|uniref:Uncharacterized protein n=1 Tax=Paractinoplanes atraurantiacus TaxID=1036182 RepID=A0A285KJR3_9ACTN|nr:hypothetical protein [Actinoplanes atraurantiacus]SNY72848.1 hypothetical protein SAMN05421748_14430 [Actinoplanes atraurantiacus]